MGEWRNIELEGFEDMYQVSDTGFIRSLDRVIYCRDGRTRHTKGKEKTQIIDKNGYKYVTFDRKQIGLKKNVFVHRLVASAFIENPQNKPQVNHINGKPTNNNVSNLEWATNKENNFHAISTGLITKNEMSRKGKLLGKWAKQNKSKSVAKILNGQIIQIYENMNDILKEGIYKSISNISNCCNNKILTAYGYEWKFI